MKLLIAIIRPERLGAVQKALSRCGVDQVTVSHVLGRGHESGQALIYRSTTIEEKLLPRVKLEIALETDAVDSVICVIQQSAKTGRIGDGMIWLLPLVQAIRIRTGVAINSSSDEEEFAEPITVGGRMTGRATSRPRASQIN
jgi:nitrogen regulatory protein P-II 2